jgi:hypothetical protein
MPVQIMQWHHRELAVPLVLIRRSKHTWLGIQRRTRRRRALVRMESGPGSTVVVGEMEALAHDGSGICSAAVSVPVPVVGVQY